ncbi:Type III pantothenate kinase [Peptoniphilus sp. ING2-D1G]|nr:Type III pantothenate kinase [Peptoniphilus sp. ING2-D1G]
MLLAINIKNKDVSFGIYQKDELLENYRIKSDIKKSEDEIYILMNSLLKGRFKSEQIEAIIISSVVPELTDIFKIMIKKYLQIEPLIVGSGIKTGLNIKYENPKEVGSDRIVDSVSAIKNYSYPAIIVNLGDIITFDVINKHGNYMGGMIFPGIGIAQKALLNFSAKLPQVEIIKAGKAISNSTIKSMQSGLYYSYVNLFDGNIKTLLDEMKLKSEEVSIIVTGEYADLLTSATKYPLIKDKNLTLKGLKIIYDMNTKKS